MRAGGGRGGGDVARALRVDAGGELLALLRAVDVGPGGAVDDGVRGRVAHGLRRGGRVGDVDLWEVEAHRLVAGRLRGGEEVLPEHPRRSDDEQSHGPHY